jgi:hypothetical protein
MSDHLLVVRANGAVESTEVPSEEAVLVEAGKEEAFARTPAFTAPVSIIDAILTNAPKESQHTVLAYNAAGNVIGYAGTSAKVAETVPVLWSPGAGVIIGESGITMPIAQIALPVGGYIVFTAEVDAPVLAVYYRSFHLG